MGTTTNNSASALNGAATATIQAAQASTAMLSSPPAHNLPDRPLIIIEPSKAQSTLSLRELWAYRELLYFLTWRDVKVRYKQTVLGAAWAILQPVFMMLIFSLFFGRLDSVRAGLNLPYPLFVFAGLVPWTFFANSVSASSNSLVGSAGLITKVYFPRLLVPLSAVAAGFVDFVLAFVVLVGMLIYYGVSLTMSMAMLPVLIVLTYLFALGVGTWMSALNVKYRDIRFVLPFLIQLWLFVSSVIVPSTTLPEKWRWLLLANPMSGIIEGYRSALFGYPFNWGALSISAAITCAVLVYAVFSFRRTEKTFADII
jgi:lipopolysaccharide transport system permease protein